MTARNDRSARQRLDVEVRRDAIVQAAAEVFSTGSYQSVATAQIATAARASSALIFHYFGSKAGLYAAVVQRATSELRTAQRLADEAMPPGSSVRDRLRTSLYVYLDHTQTQPWVWAAPLRGEEPPEAQQVRHRARAEDVAVLQELLQPAPGFRDDFAVWGFFGFLDRACLRWVDQGCPDDQRHDLVTTCLGALEGALGDWRR